MGGEAINNGMYIIPTDVPAQIGTVPLNIIRDGGNRQVDLDGSINATNNELLAIASEITVCGTNFVTPEFANITPAGRGEIVGQSLSGYIREMSKLGFVPQGEDMSNMAFRTREFTIVPSFHKDLGKVQFRMIFDRTMLKNGTGLSNFFNQMPTMLDLYAAQDEFSGEDSVSPAYFDLLEANMVEFYRSVVPSGSNFELSYKCFGRTGDSQAAALLDNLLETGSNYDTVDAALMGTELAETTSIARANGEYNARYYYDSETGMYTVNYASIRYEGRKPLGQGFKMEVILGQQAVSHGEGNSVYSVYGYDTTTYPGVAPYLDFDSSRRYDTKRVTTMYVMVNSNTYSGFSGGVSPHDINAEFAIVEEGDGYLFFPGQVSR